MKKDQGYEQIEHTGDVGIRVYGESLEEIFASAATGMFDIIFDELPQEKQLIEEVVVTADDLEEL
ncbi:archease, partial [candidate division KSB1 bacterium]|nr:archease [candidate division KSB1 bacterium]